MCVYRVMGLSLTLELHLTPSTSGFSPNSHHISLPWSHHLSSSQNVGVFKTGIIIHYNPDLFFFGNVKAIWLFRMQQVMWLCAWLICLDRICHYVSKPATLCVCVCVLKVREERLNKALWVNA